MSLKAGSGALVLLALSAVAEWSLRGSAPTTLAAPASAVGAAPAVEKTALSANAIAELARAFTGSIEGRVRKKDVYGAGVVVNARGHVLTCWHLVDGLEPLQVRFADGESVAAKVVDRDAGLDVALLELATPRREFARLGSVAALRAGDEVFAMGTPRKMRFSLSRGMLSYAGREFEGVRYLQTDLPMSGGSSGGPVLDAGGALIGIASFVLRDTAGMGFALPIDYALRRFRRTLEHQPDELAFERWLSSGDPSAGEGSRRRPN